MWNVSALWERTRLSFPFSGFLSWKENIIFRHTRSPPHLSGVVGAHVVAHSISWTPVASYTQIYKSVCAFTGDLQQAGSVSLHPKAAGENEHLAVEHTKWLSTCWHAALEVGHKRKPVNKTQTKIPELKCFLCYFIAVGGVWTISNLKPQKSEEICAVLLCIKRPAKLH